MNAVSAERNDIPRGAWATLAASATALALGVLAPAEKPAQV